MRPPTFGEILRFLDRDTGWQRTRQTDHDFYEKTLPSGEVLSTHVSHALDKSPGPGRFSQILRYQLKVSADEFWAVIAEDRPARRPAPAAPPAPRPLSVNLAMQLEKQLGLRQSDLVGMTQDEAVRLLQEHYAKEKPGS